MKKVIKKLAAFALVFTLLMQMWNVGVFAAPVIPDTRVTDASTMTDWQKWFGDTVLNTENAGGVWGDKSVFKSADEFNAALEAGVADYDISMTSDGTNFLVALSAVAANKSIIGYSALPTDTMFVLDLSNSMTNTAMSNMINAANDAIAELYELNRSNRIGVVVYAGSEVNSQGGGFGGPGGNNNDAYGLSASATVLLPIGRYDPNTDRQGNQSWLTYSNDTVAVADGVLELGRGERNPSKRAEGATYIQAGIQLAVDEFKDVEETVIESGPQAGTTRMPVMVLMSDGAPTVATTQVNNVGNSTHGSGSSATQTTAYLTQLSCAWARKEMNAHYGRAGLFYTLGLNVGDSAVARSVLNPSSQGTPYTTWWSEYAAAAARGSSTITHGSNYSGFTVPVISGLERIYVDQYFSASSEAGLSNAFKEIVDQIIIQSKYYPTLVDDGEHHIDGYITFHDELGPYMEVREIKGLTVGGNYYKGSAIAREIRRGTFGNIYGGNLNNLNEEGLAFLSAIEERLGCTEAEAGAIASQALKDGQLYYNSETDFSNYIGWYADRNGNFLGYWNGKDHTSKPADAVYANKSYGFMGTVGNEEEYNETDMLHISVQVSQNIENLHQKVIYKIPAILIPTVNYNIEFNGDELETGTDFEMSIDGANEALRLIFEVGLRSDINRINIADKVKDYENVSDGVYTFYSNSWNEHSHSSSALVDDHDATWFEFEPSYENERYYYTVNSPIYEKDGDNYTLVTADPKGSAETFYTRQIVFTTSAVGRSDATMNYKFVPIKAETLDEYATEAEDGTYYIPKQTVHRLLEDSEGHGFRIPKEGEDVGTAEKTHPTKTLNYSNYPQVVFLADGTIHCDACLGNNGTFSVTAAQGIKLSKTMAVAGLGEGESFTFKITLKDADLADSYPLHDVDGNYLRDVAVNESGEMTVPLSAEETVYIADLPTGVSYTVEEIFGDEPEYKVKESSGATGTVEAHKFGEVVFTNELLTHGNLLIHKEVVLPEAVGARATYNGTFDVAVTFPNNDVSSVKVNGVTKEIAGGVLNLTIAAGQTIVISQIPNGTEYVVSEPGLPDFWTSNIEASSTAISDSADSVVLLTNTYEVGQIDPMSVEHTGLKKLSGREWLETDEFTFAFQYFNSSNWVTYNGTETVSGNSAKIFSFTDALQSFVENEIDSVGTYQFRVVEQPADIGGVNYDVYPKRFEVVVGNNFETGRLEITNVTTVTPAEAATAQEPNPNGTAITKDNGVYKISTTFENVYRAAGSTDVTINITKALEDNTGLNRGLAGFEFELYQLDANEQKINVESLGATDEDGKLSYAKSWGASFVGETLTYYLAEVDTDEDGIIYDLDARRIDITIVDNLDGSISAKVNGVAANTYAATFENEYVLDPATVKFDGAKRMDGRDLTAEDVIEIELYKSDSTFSSQALVDTDQVENGAFKLEHEVEVAGLHYYIIKEKATGLPGVDDDSGVYYITVNVGKGTGATLDYTVETILKDTDTKNDIEFVNTYTPNPEEFTIKGEKKLDGRDIKDGEFTFILKDEDGEEIDRTDVADDAFSFDPIPITKKGTYVYTVEEVKGDAAGVTYDDTVYTVTLTVTDDGKAKLTLTDVISTEDESDLDGIVFENTYTPNPEEYVISGDKILHGRDTEDGEFTFILKDEDGEEIDRTDVADDAFSFDPIPITKKGTYVYTVEEVKGDAAGVTYDDTVYTVTLTVTDDGKTNLTLTDVISTEDESDLDGIVFENTYTPNPEEYVISGDKILHGRDTEDGEFTFILKDEDGEELDTATVKDGKFEFDEIIIEAKGTYIYTVEEVKGDAAGVTYDTTVYTVTLTVTDDGKTNLTIDEKISAENEQALDTLVFNNTYTPNSETFIISGDKTLTGRAMKDGEFSFVLKDKDGKELDTATVKDGKFTFDALTFQKAGVYVYTVEEVKGDATGVTYDDTVYTVTLTVTDDGKANLTLAEVISTKDGAVSGIAFNNTYTAPAEPPKENPKTGDSNNLFMWVALLFVSGGGLFGATAFGKREEKE